MITLISNNVKKHVCKLWVYITTAALMTISLVLTCLSFGVPVMEHESIVTNNIEQTCNIHYAADVVACTLYPKGEIMEPEGIMIGSIIKNLVFDVEAVVRSSKPINVNGSSRMNAVLVADKLWKREFPLSRVTNFDTNSDLNTLISGKFRLDIGKIFDFIDQVEKETQIPPNKYILYIQPEIEGTIKSGEFSAKLASTPALMFELAGKKIIQITAEGEEIYSQSDVEPFSTKFSATQDSVSPNHFSIVGVTISVLTTRFILCGLTLLFTCVWLYIHMQMRVNRPKPSQEECIKRKYASRIYPLNIKIHSMGKKMLELKSFAHLLKLSEERELPIFYAVEDDRLAHFLLLDADYLYFFAAQRIPGQESNLDQSIGSENWEAGL